MIKRNAKTAQQKPIDSEASAIVEISLDKLHDHPLNPEPTVDEVKMTAEWLKSRGQDEPIVVRPLPDPIGHYEILAGRRRCAGACLLGWDTIQCRIRRDLEDETAAVTFMAASNAQRHTETPIRQALMIQAMVQSGLTLKEAGAVYGLESESAARNKLQLLKLPEVWRDRVVSGEIPETAARCLAPYSEYPSIMKAIDEAYRQDQEDEWAADDWKGRDQFEDCVESIVKQSVAFVEKGQTRNYGSELGFHHPCYLKMTDELERELGVVSLPLGPNGKNVRVATNLERFNELQIPLIKAKLAKKAGRSKDDASRPEKPRTAAEAKQLAKKNAEQLEKRIARWRHEWLRELIAKKLLQKVPDHWVLTKIVMWCLAQSWRCGKLNFGDAVLELGGGRAKHEYCYSDGEEIQKVLSEKLCTQQNLMTLVTDALRSPEKNPDFPVWPHGLLTSIATDLQIDLAEEWRLIQSISPLPADRFVAFFELHQSPQLDELGKELGVHVLEAKNKATKIKVLTGTDRVLRLPASIKPLKERK